MVKRRKLSRLRRYGRHIRRRIGKGRLSLLVTIPLVKKAIVEPIIDTGALEKVQAGDFAGAYNGAMTVLAENFSGYNYDTKSWNFQKPIETYGLMAIGKGGSMLASRFGANAYVKKIPVIGRIFKL